MVFLRLLSQSLCWGALTRSPLAVVAIPGSMDHLMDGVPALGNDHLQVKVTHARDFTRVSGSGAVRVDRVCARAWTLTRHEEAVVGDRVNLPEVAFAVEYL